MFWKVVFYTTIVASLPLLSEAIKCYRSVDREIIDQCQYCGIANVTRNTNAGIFNQVYYDCLHEPKMQIDGLTFTEQNQCQTLKMTINAWTSKMSLYICDKDLCNVYCGSGRYELGVAVVLSTILCYVFQQW